jgi:uncharacterized protein YbjT (DUF2867 family)
MSESSEKTIVVCGVTGRQGGAVARHLLEAGWRVRGITRDPGTAKAKDAAARGIEIVRADMADHASLERAFAGADGVFSVQNPHISGFGAEIEQGRTVADAAKAAGVKHVVYGAAGIGSRTGVPSWDTKVAVEEHIASLGLPATVLRPMAFMELMTDKAYYPQVSIWHVMRKLLGDDVGVPWLAVDDVGAVAAAVFADRERFVGQSIQLGADVRTMGEVHALWIDTFGRPPSKFPMPLFLFQRIAGAAGKDLPKMYGWLKTGTLPDAVGATRAVHPTALTVREWMQRRKASTPAA